MKFVIGIDGGGTRTQITVCEENGKVVASSIAGPSNILSSGYDIAKESITKVITDGFLRRGYRLSDCVSFCIGVAGAGRDYVKEQIEEIVRSTGYRGPLIVTHDAETALAGGTAGEEGILIMAGTGTICYGRNEEGKIHRVSGWGHIIGDEGSAYGVSVQILNSVMKAHDGRGNPTILTDLVLDYMQLKQVEDIIGEIYRPGVTKQHIAEFAVLIEEACDKNDEVALAIIEDAINEIFECVVAGIDALGFAKKKVKIIISGTMLVTNSYIRKGFEQKLKYNYPLVNICTMIKDASYGAAWLARQNLINPLNIST
ncbi:MAG: hypothetical protein ATN36_00100 [Epulopiscium sp. Nele67-Bin005]|nr:MAG: hypothetical protein ATN36_00100 [Epulopiscium sp. Nele67-Bin005]